MWESCLEMAHAQASQIPMRSLFGILSGGFLIGNPFLEFQIATELITSIGREVRRAEEQAGVHWTQLPSPNEEVPSPVSDRTGQIRAFDLDEFLSDWENPGASLPWTMRDLALPSPIEEVLLPVSDRAPGTDTHGRAFSSDEDGDGPCVPIQKITRYFRSCFGKGDERENDLMIMQALRERADVPPACEICHTPCRLYAFCSFCRQSPVMHHGRCCYLNPGRRRREAEKAAASEEEWL
jgi:hypothetical protein